VVFPDLGMASFVTTGGYGIEVLVRRGHTNGSKRFRIFADAGHVCRLGEIRRVGPTDLGRVTNPAELSV